MHFGRRKREGYILLLLVAATRFHSSLLCVSQNRYVVTWFPYKSSAIFIGPSNIYVHSGVVYISPEKAHAIKKAQMFLAQLIIAAISNCARNAMNRWKVMFMNISVEAMRMEQINP